MEWCSDDVKLHDHVSDLYIMSWNLILGESFALDHTILLRWRQLVLSQVASCTGACGSYAMVLFFCVYVPIKKIMSRFCCCSGTISVFVNMLPQTQSSVNLQCALWNIYFCKINNLPFTLTIALNFFICFYYQAYCLIKVSNELCSKYGFKEFQA